MECHGPTRRWDTLGCKWSQVQILSPRPAKAPGIIGESLDSGGFVFQDPGSLHRGCISLCSALEGEGALHVDPVVLDAAVVVDGSRDLGRAVAEALLHGTEVHARLAEQGRVRVSLMPVPA